jgi:hypothetical protein
MNIFILGRKYQGKSTLATSEALRIREETGAYKVLVFDPKWQTRIFPAYHKIENFKFNLHNDDSDGITFQAGSNFGDEQDDSEQVQDDFTLFCRAIGVESHLRYPPERPIIIVIDEAYYLQGKGYLHPWLGRMIRLATEGKLYIIQAGHRPVDLTPDVRGKGDIFFFFRQTDFTDLRVVQEIAGENAAIIVESLPQHHALRYDVNRQTFEVLDNPTEWFINISERQKEYARS